MRIEENVRLRGRDDDGGDSQDAEDGELHFYDCFDQIVEKIEVLRVVGSFYIMIVAT